MQRKECRGASGSNVCRLTCVSEADFYAFTKKHHQLLLTEIRTQRQLREKKACLKLVGTDLILQIHTLGEF